MEIPQGHQTVMPYLMLKNAKDFIEFIKNVFGAEMTHENYNEDGTVGHCEANIGGSTIMFSNSRGEWKPATSNMFVYVDDADARYNKAIYEGAAVLMKPTDQDYGRSCGVTDPFGNVWWITSVKGKGEGD